MKQAEVMTGNAADPMDLDRRADRRATRRWTTDLDISFRRDGSRAFTGRMIEISRAGCKLATGFTLDRGIRIFITIPGFETFVGVTAWAENEMSGIRLHKELYPAVVDHILSLNPRHSVELNRVHWEMSLDFAIWKVRSLAAQRGE
jgi:hypothetical protein